MKKWKKNVSAFVGLWEWVRLDEAKKMYLYHITIDYVQNIISKSEKNSEINMSDTSYLPEYAYIDINIQK